MSFNSDVQEDIPPSSVPVVLLSFDSPDIDISSSLAVGPPRSHEASDSSKTLLIRSLRSFARNAFSLVLAAAAKIWIILKSLARLVNKPDTLENPIPVPDPLQSSIRHLPEELLSYIFLLCLPVSRKFSSFDISASPLLFMRVCKPWRRCALSLQALWTSFTILSDHNLPPSFVRTWMSHAQLSPLSPYLILRGGSQDRLAWPAVDEVIRYCDRWRSLHIESTTDMLRHIGSIRGRLSSLEFLHLGLDDTPNYRQAIGAFVSAPRLRVVRLLSYVVPSPSRLYLPWGQLTSLELIHALGKLSHLQALLQQSPNLVNLKVVYLKTSPAAASEVQLLPVDLSHLKRLRLICPGTEDTSCLLRCPNLTHLWLRICDTSMKDALPLLFLATLPSLRVLDLQAYFPEGTVPPDLVPCLRVVPTVTSLCIGASGNTMTDSLLSALVYTVGSADRILLPKLKELAINIQDNSIVNKGLVTAVSLSRAGVADVSGLVITLLDNRPWNPRKDPKHSA
ncbi:hypothetical protein FIBSPDRAFT_896383 [Athelia psychrophila]|uniref:Uncharacterized protein n=1 Tax=Athelia psychrophila TaxID=1759441 RepID=A0A166DES5_9AGAM|nr:hypothetical protein FIBSPDRAFT_896383 [Fibularhizoctonia sp. CBS 109695]